MFPITIPTLVTEKCINVCLVYFLTQEKILAKYVHFDRNLGSLSLTFTENLRRFSFLLFASLIIFQSMYFGTDFQIRKAYQACFLEIWSKLHIWERYDFCKKQTEDFFIAMMTSSKFLILRKILAKYGFPIEKELFSRLLSSCWKYRLRICKKSRLDWQ